ncbi:MAG: ECF-type sigma factor [Gemmataceae bacterium]
MQPTALVHEAYLRLVDADRPQRWDGRRHFIAAAAEAMRRILVDNARRKRSAKRGGGASRHDLADLDISSPETSEDLLALDEALEKLAGADKPAAELVKLRYFAGLTAREAADILGVSERTADRLWAFGRSWLMKEIRGT